MRKDDSLPSYEQLFGDLDFWENDEARSVYSPAAYLADLLRLMRSTFDGPGLLDRRPDVAQIVLDADNTFVESPYLDIVNEVLENLLDGPAYETLKTLRHPFGLPFSLDNEQLKTYLKHLQVGPDEFYRLFAPTADPDVIARLYLGLSQEDVQVLATEVTSQALLGTFYGLKDGETPASLAVVERFKEATGLTALELRELLLGDEADLDRPPTGFFVHQGGVPVTMTADGLRLVQGEGPVPVQWFERVNRFVRLARRTGLTLTDLDRVLTSCCAGRIDGAALRTIAVVVHLQRAYELTADGVCGLAVAIWPAGHADLPACSGDILAAHNKEFRRLLARSIETAENDVVEIVRRYRERYDELEPSPFDRGEIGPAAIGLLQRAGRFVAALGISVGELFGLLEILESDPSLRRYTTFSILGLTLDGTEPATPDCFRILEGGDPASSLWLAETLFAVVRWMQTSGFGGDELAEILGGPPAERDDADQVTVLDAINRRFEPVGLAPEAFVSKRFGERAAQVVHDVLTAYDDGVVSARDERLLRLDRARAATAAYDAVTDLGVVVREDFLGLGLDERLTAKVYAQLLFAGRLRADGALVTESMPATVGELKLTRDFGGFREPLFKLVNSVSNGTSSFFPSDLATIGDLGDEQLAELYDNLIFNGYVNEDGDVLDPGFFADEANAPGFEVNVALDDVAPAVLAELLDRVRRFEAEKLLLDPGIFADLRLTEARLQALTESLRFNGYLGEDGAYLDKAALAAIRPDDFGLALEFYPDRRAVLDAVRGQIAAFRAEVYACVPGDFAEMCDEAFADRVIAALGVAHLDEGRVADRAAFESGAELVLDGPFTYGERAVVAGRVAEILLDEKPYRLDLDAVTELGFTDDERAALVELLVAGGHLTAALAVPENRLAYFRNVANALVFHLDGLDDFDKDVFFLLNAVAVELAAAIGEITATLENRAVLQFAALYGGLADAFGVPEATVKAICDAVTGGPAESLDALVAPVLAAADLTGGEITAVPADPHLRQSYRRVRRFALLAGKLGLDETEVTVVFQDQDLTGKFPEPLALPPGLDRFDAVLESSDGNIYLFGEGGYWTYSAATYALLEPAPKPLTELSARFTGLIGVDAAFAHPTGDEWIIARHRDGGSRVFVKATGTTRWAPREQIWGKVRNNFDAPKHIDSAFVDEDGKTYLFSGDQYVRYSGTDYTAVDEGYPRAIAGWWLGEGHETPLPPAFRKAIDASFQDTDGRIHLFSGDRYLAVADGYAEHPISEAWGKVRNSFVGAGGVDAAYSAGAASYLFAGNQVIRYSDSIENDGVRVDDGYPKRIESTLNDVPGEFETGIEAAFADDGVPHLFKDGRTVTPGTPAVRTADRWGVLGAALPSGTVDAGFVGLDGKTYVFSGDKYVRYASADYSAVDLGYPRGVAGDWGGLRTVDASLVMDGKTYLFGLGGLLFEVPLEQEAELRAGRLSPALRRRFLEHGLPLAENATPTDPSTSTGPTTPTDPTTPTGPTTSTGAAATGQPVKWQVTAEQGITVTLRRETAAIRVYADDSRYYVRYSTRNYATPDAGYPKPVSDNWWNLPATLAADPAFAVIDAVFTGRDGQTYLFSGDRFVVFDTRHRWWSEPRTLAEHWDSLPFTRVDAAFIGKDGKTYVFSGDRYVRYSTADYTRVDDRYPASVRAFWWNVVNAIARTGRVDAALVTDAVELVDGVEVPHTYTYLFSGGQYVRYDGPDRTVVDDGYPRGIASLAGEPRMAALPVTLDGVDAAFADRRNVYLFRGSTCHVVSDSLYKVYDKLDLSAMRCAFMEDGSLLVERPTGWLRHSSIEGETVTATPATPRVLREVPPEFRVGLDSVLSGADGNTYLFKGPLCFNVGLDRAYPLTEEWGRPRNAIYQDNRVDAAFVGRDGGTYLFSGDQFVVYTDGDESIVGDPRPIEDRWAGLTSVTLAYVRGGITYVFEKPGENGDLRYLVYSGDDYTTPDPGYPMVTGPSFWEVPEEYRTGAPAAPDAVLFENDTMILVYGDRCVQFDEATRQWSYPRPVERIWRGLGQGLEPEDTVRAAFTALDGSTYFFFGEQYTRYADRSLSAYAPIRDRWGRSLNPFVGDDATATVDAAFVWRGETTYLFSGKRYVRYSGSEYRYVDPGYPKEIIGNLRGEEPFAHLEDAFEDAVTDRVAAGETRLIDAVVANRRNVYLFVGGSCHVVSSELSASYELDRLGSVRNTVADTGKVDAALVRGAQTFLFAGDQYVRYSGTEYDVVDDGYPRTIGGSLAGELGLPTLPDEFAAGLDAAFRVADGGTYLFKGTQYLRADISTVAPVPSLWGRVRNEFAGATGVDAAFAAPGGQVYAFRNGQYIRYQPDDLEYVEEGYPRTVRDDWGDLPAAFEAGPDGAFVFEGRTYLLKDDLYVRYSGDGYDAVDRTFPQLFKRRWSDTADYRLSDVHTIVRFVDLARAHSGDLAGFLRGGPVEDPYAQVSELFGWDVDEVRWARRNAALITGRTPEEERFEIEFLLRLAELFKVAAKFGTGPSAIHADAWSKLATDPAAAGAALYLMLERLNSPEDWLVLSGLIHDELNLLKRDALVPAALTALPGLTSSRDLYERFLLDVDMGGAGRTSRVREAIAAAQLYLHRYLLDLEKVGLPGGEEQDEVRRQVKSWWAWMKNYRIWEANRKVFLYPENYIRPELRDSKTPVFADLESDLLQGEITEDTVQRAYKKYLDEYTEVSRLAIAGGYVYHEDDADENTRRLVVFGRTRTEPRRYYHREAEFRDGEKLSATWEPWLKVGVQIDADKVHPVHAFGRVFVFWTMVEAVPPKDAAGTVVTATKEPDGSQKVSAPSGSYRVKIFYSFRNLNEDWVPAQLLPVDEKQDLPISDVGLYIQASRSVPGGAAGAHDSIVITCTYKVPGKKEPVEVKSSYALTPELYAVPAEGAVVPARAVDLSRIFNEPDTSPISPEGVVRFNAPADTPDGPWVSVDHKGGSFLCRPVAAAAAPQSTTELGKNGDLLPATWSRIDAGVELPDGTRYFFDNAAKKYVLTPATLDSKGRSRDDTVLTWGIVRNGLNRNGVVDAVLVRRDQTFLFSGNEYYRYSGKPFGPLDAGYPKRLDTNNENLPLWTKVDAAFTATNGTEFFFSRKSQGYAESGSLAIVHPIGERWTLPDNTKVNTALYYKNFFFLFLDEGKYLRFAENDTRNGERRSLEKNGDGLPQSGTVNAAFAYGGKAYFFDNDKGTLTLMGGKQPETSKTRDLGVVETAITRTGAVDAAYVANGKLYLTSGLEFVRYTLTGSTVPDGVDAGYPKKLSRQVKAVFRRNDLTYVFSGADYAVLADGQELDAPLDYDSIAGNWGALPAGFATDFTGAMDGADLFLFEGPRYAKYLSSEAIQRPFDFAGLPHEIVRLTSSTAYKLNRELLTGGLPALLAPETQETDELPAFSATVSNATTVKVTRQVGASRVPTSSHLDFQSANGIYYWEIFFHAPLLIAQALNSAQRFEDARRWYEYVFDPTEQTRYWRFLPFLAVDVSALVESCRADLAGLKALSLNVTAVENALNPVLAQLEPLARAFLQNNLTGREADYLESLGDDGLNGVVTALDALSTPAPELPGLRERVAIIGRLRRQYDLMGDRGKLLHAYLEDPFDPHAIAELRPSAYRRVVVMAYIDNLLDWGDLLFRQYTAESIDEARMLYVFAYDLLGDRPDDLGPRRLSKAQTYDELDAPLEEAAEGDDLLELTGGGSLLEGPGAVHRSVADPYFYVPENTVFFDYWTRVEDRLRKIRMSLDIMGISRPVPLFEPPADVMALVQGVAAGASLDQLTASMAAPVPFYRFSFLFRKAEDLVDRLRQYGADLSSALDRRDAEELSLLQNRQEAVMLALTRGVKEAQVQIAQEGLLELQASKDSAASRAQHYEQLVENGMSALEIAQMAMMTVGAYENFVASGLKVGSAIATVAPQVLLGPFIVGTEFGGEQLGQALDKVSDVASTMGEGFSMLGELLGVRAAHDRSVQDWQLQLATAQSDVVQLGHQVVSAGYQVAVAQRELAILDQDIANTKEVATFLTDKFGTAQLYQWISGRMSTLYFQAYNLAYETAKAAERAYQFERGESGNGHIQPAYWESRHSGLLAGETLAIDLERLGKAYSDNDRRGLQITKKVSLLALDPLALLALRTTGRCEFALTEALFDRDFPGHFGRRIRTLSVTFQGEDGPIGVNATLTQVDNKTVLTADPKAVKFLLDPKGSPPDTLRGDWRPSEQIALSDIEEYRDNNGLFELRYDDDRYLPFEGTGAVSRWRLELSGSEAAGLRDVVVTLKYDAEQGGSVFADAVRGMLKPYPAARLFDVVAEFPEEWAAFAEGGDDRLELPFTPEMLPGISGRQITGVYPVYGLAERGGVRFLLNGDRRFALTEGKLLSTPGLGVGGAPWKLVLEGDKAALTSLGLVLTYRAAAR